MLTVADTAPAVASPPAPTTTAIVLVALLMVGSWVSFARFIWPAVRSQNGRAYRLSRHARLRLFAQGAFRLVLPVLCTLALLIVLQGPPDAKVVNALVFGLAAGGITLGIAAFVMRCIERHQMRAQQGMLGLPTPRAPLWPGAAVAVWVVAVCPVPIAAGVLYWIHRFDDLTARYDAVKPAVRAASSSSDPEIQQILAGGGDKDALEIRVGEMMGLDRTSDIHSMQTDMWTTVVAGFVFLVLVAIGGFLVFRRQVRRRATYDHRVAAAAARSAGLVGSEDRTPGPATKQRMASFSSFWLLTLTIPVTAFVAGILTWSLTQSWSATLSVAGAVLALFFTYIACVLTYQRVGGAQERRSRRGPEAPAT